MVEGAMTFPLMTLVALALVNLALAGFASVSANNAVNYAARLASVDQQTPGATAYAAAHSALQGSIGSYTVQVTQADSFAGGRVSVTVRWSVPNFFGGLMPLFGRPVSPLQGEAISVFRKEGW
jgi:Flp pilus assembly protein TadG